MFKERVVVTENVKVSRAFYKLTFRSAAIAGKAAPGHFVQIRVSDSYDPFLPRPMSICRSRGDLIDILYIPAGRGTRMMTLIPEGARLEVWGPLGKPFTPMPGKRMIFVSGGVGIAPMIFLAAKLPVDAFLFGVRTKDDLVPLEEFGIEQSKIYLSSNDGTVGRKGYITEVFDRLMEKVKSEDCFVYTCGPTPMMKLIVQTAKKKKLSGEASLEELMACGVGACLGCVTDTKAGRITVCHDGPVMPFEVLPW